MLRIDHACERPCMQRRNQGHQCVLSVAAYHYESQDCLRHSMGVPCGKRFTTPSDEQTVWFIKSANQVRIQDQQQTVSLEEVRA